MASDSLLFYEVFELLSDSKWSGDDISDPTKETGSSKSTSRGAYNWSGAKKFLSIKKVEGLINKLTRAVEAAKASGKESIFVPFLFSFG